MNKLTLKKSCLLLSALIMSGCATSSKSILMGASIGGATGGLMGSQANDSKNAAIGVAAGMAIGGLIGHLAFSDKSEKKKVTPDKKAFDDFPFITKPVVRKYSPAPKVEGNRYIRNCEIFEIKENAKWREK
jgi:uncharacterized membrane protein YebE (DUF533 family)